MNKVVKEEIICQMKNLKLEVLKKYGFQVFPEIRIFCLTSTIVLGIKGVDGFSVHFIRGESNVDYKDWTSESWHKYFSYVARSLGLEENGSDSGELYFSDIDKFFYFFRENIGFSCEYEFEFIEDLDKEELKWVIPYFYKNDFEVLDLVGNPNEDVVEDSSIVKEFIKVRASYTDSELRSVSLFSEKNGLIMSVNSIYIKVVVKSRFCNFSSSEIIKDFGQKYFDCLKSGDEIDLFIDGLGVYWIAEKGV